MSNQVMERLNAKEICERRDQIEVQVIKAMDALGEADRLLKTICTHGFYFDRNVFYSPSEPSNRSKASKALMQQADQKLWGRVIELGQFKDLMSVKQRRAIDEQLERCPRLSYETLTATFGELLQNRPNLLKDLVETAFAERSKEFKNNQGMKINKKHIVGKVFCKYGFNMHGYASERLEDITKAIAFLEGEDSPHVISILSESFDYSWLDGRVEFKKFKNGNVHVFINDQLIIDRLNDVLSGAMGAKVGENKS